MHKTGQGFQLDYHFFDTPLGHILIGASPEGICLLHFLGLSDSPSEASRGILTQTFPEATVTKCQRNPLLREVERAVLKYFHDHHPLAAFPLDLHTGTSFQHQVWKTLCTIPFGETRSYLQIALALDKPRSCRAVGQACGKNPIPILIPCHRVISADRRLGGFSGGLHIKKALLGVEQAPGFSEQNSQRLDLNP
ncbi:MAG TPA: methylated-DNA--[protein]-cysteine S-methyltransferase [Syntrophobacteraceae bacterium]|nr:methylated-DNA--[protein]-cysteine S-methyltransferase [Syntrophobacteraceae bacterium]